MSADTGVHKPWFIAVITAAVLMFVLTCVLNGLGSGTGGLFINSIGGLSDKYYLEITPAGWTFSIWGFIYTWQALWLLYGVLLIFRKGELGPAYHNPPVLSPVLYGVYCLNLGLNITWLFVWDREVIPAAFVVLGLIAFTLYICLFLTYRALDTYAGQLLKENRTLDIWLIRMFVHNGLGIYATWTSIASLLNLAHVIAYESSPAIGQDIACTVSLSILSLEIIIFFTTDIFLLDRYSRYTFTPYIVVIVALTGSISDNWSEGARNSIFTLVLLSVAGVMGLIKFSVTLWRHFKKPLYGNSATITSEGTKA